MPDTHDHAQVTIATAHNLARVIDQAAVDGLDVTTIIELVMMQVARAADDDLRRIAKEVQEANDQKRRLREQLARRDAFADAAELRRDLDTMSELGETESLRLQMAMDRMSKMMSTLSNLLKKISDTANSITQNIK